METTTLSARVSKDLKNRLDQASRITRRSKNFLLTEALEHYLSELLDLRIAIERANDPTDKLLTVEEFVDAIGIQNTSEVLGDK